MISREVKCLSCGNIFTISVEDNISLFSEKLQILKQKLVEAGIHQSKPISVFALDKIFRDVFLEGRKW
jgi:hypothetical protein